ncbi:response regulator [Clostridioides sp. ES-S-0001-02]|uniref:response regulator n=1 Tax=Clostridioides sp. ES-S-0001-02 TaxID=2770770 RepID=UPI0039BD020F
MSKRILVIEDDIDIQNIIKTFLENADYTIITANNGLDGIEKFKKQQFDFIRHTDTKNRWLCSL